MKSVVHVLAPILLMSMPTFAGLPEYDKPGPDEMRAHFVNVGQGAATILEFSCGIALLDTGAEKNPEFRGDENLKTYLNELFDRRPDLPEATIDLLVLSHAHADHTSGVKMIFNNFKIKNIVTNGKENADQKLAHSKARASRGRTKLQRVNEGGIQDTKGLTSTVIDPFSCAGTDPLIRVLWGGLGEETWDASVAEGPNNSSVVTRVDFGKASFLFPGDLEDEVHAEYRQFYLQDCLPSDPETCALDIDVYHVAHHGSHNGTNPELMRAMTPRLAVISVGDPDREKPRTAWNHGHPRIDAIRALIDPDTGVSLERDGKSVMVANRSSSKRNARGPQFSPLVLEKAVYATSWDGAVVVTAFKNGDLKVDVER